MGSWRHRPGWPPGLPPPDDPGFGERAAAWLSATILPPELGRAAPVLHTYPKAAGRVAWYCLRAQTRGGAVRVGTVLPPRCLDGLLPEDAAATLQPVEIPAGGVDAADRLAVLAVVGPHLPRRITG